MKNLFFSILIIFIAFSCTVKEGEGPVTKKITGEYLGEVPPEADPKVFAPGIISTKFYNRDITITPDGKEIYYCVITSGYKFSAIVETKLVNNEWTEPKVASFCSNPKYRYIEPSISPDGKKFYFLCNMPDTANGETELDTDIWVMDREGDGWGKPYNLGAPINSEDDEFFPSVTNTGTIYFTRAKKGQGGDQIYRSKFIDGKYQEPELLPKEINSGRARYNAFIAPDESYIIVPIFGREDSYGATDYYISYRTEDDKWIGPINMGEKINTADWQEYSPYVSPDGKYFFFMTARGNENFDSTLKQNSMDLYKKFYDSPFNGLPSIYWVNTSFIEELKPEELK